MTRVSIDVKITEIRVYPVEIPYKKPFKIATATYLSQPFIYVEVKTDSGITGFGEACPAYEFTGETMGTVTAIIKERLEKCLIGLDPFNIDEAVRLMDRATVGNPSAKAAIEMALYDIVGKATGEPVCKIIGGMTRNVIPEVGGAVIADVREVLEKVKRDVDRGLKILKIKVGEDPYKDAEKIKLIREAVGWGVKIRADANQGWIKPKRAIKAIRLMEKYELELVEQPIVWWDLDGLSEIRRAVDTPIMLDESVHSPRDALRAIEKRACDIINIKLMKSGGIYNALRINAIAEVAGIPTYMGGMGETSIGHAAAIHIFAALGNMVFGDIRIPGADWGILEDPGVGLEETMINGVLHIKVPEKPGLGVELRKDIVEKYLNRQLFEVYK